MNLMEQRPELMSLIQHKFGADGKTLSSLQTKLRGSAQNAPERTGYSAVDGATDMLNEMGEETRKNLETEEERCKTEDARRKAEMETMRVLVANFNSDAAGARAKVVDAQGQIATLEVNSR